MNKKVFGRKLSRSRPAREALFASLARSVILNGKIVTTRAKAKAVQGDLEKFVTLAKGGSLEGRRRVLSSLDNARDAVSFLYQNVVPVFQNRISGFTRVISLPVRRGDNAQMVRLEWTDKVEAKKKELKTSKKNEPKSKVETKPTKVKVEKNKKKQK